MHLLYIMQYHNRLNYILIYYVILINYYGQIKGLIIILYV